MCSASMMRSELGAGQGLSPQARCGRAKSSALRKRPHYSSPDLKDDVVEELIDWCDVITSASMVGSFKNILDSNNNIITRNPRVQERFDLPYLLRHDPDHCAGMTESSPCAS